jgi:hypothetical protein
VAAIRHCDVWDDAHIPPLRSKEFEVSGELGPRRRVLAMKQARRVAAVSIAALVLIVSACSGAPDRSADAQRLKAAIAAMPGVREADVD